MIISENTTQQQGLQCPSLPCNLPRSMETLLQSTPEHARPAVAMAVFSALRIMLSEVKFRYADASLTEPCFMNLCIAPQASGKTAIRQPVNEILNQVQKEDLVNRLKLQEWREKVASLGANKQKPAEPSLPIRIVQADMTNPALVRLAKKANGHSLYTYGEELEKLFRLKGASEVIRSAFDNELYGQERVSPNGISDVVTLRWSWNFSSTPDTARRLLRNDISTGTLSRLCLSTIVQDDWAEDFPIFGEYGEEYRQKIKPYLERLTHAKGIIDCEEAKQWVMRQKAKNIDLLKMQDCKAMLPFLFRSLLMGFWRACMLYIMHGGEWSAEIEQFASWTVDYDLFCKFHFFGDMIEAQEELNNAATMHRATNLLSLLPGTFTREQAMEMRRQNGKDCSPKAPKNMLGTWVHRKFVVFDSEKQVYRKTAEYASALGRAIPHSRRVSNAED